MIKIYASFHPTDSILQNAFSNRLSQFGFDIHSSLLPDLMHKVELGGWKALFIHLLRMLESLDKLLLIELDLRYSKFLTLHNIYSNRLYSGIVRCQLLGEIQ